MDRLIYIINYYNCSKNCFDINDSSKTKSLVSYIKRYSIVIHNFNSSLDSYKTIMFVPRD